MKNKYIKGPLNYVGGKHKLLKEIIPLFPDDIETFVDVFGGGFNVGINVKSQNYIYNDLCTQVVKLFQMMYHSPFEKLDRLTRETILAYGLSDSSTNGYEFYGCDSNSGLSSYNKNKFKKLRDLYNINEYWIMLYVLIVYSFNNQIRFSSKGNFNMPCGKRDYNQSMQDKLKTFMNKLHSMDVTFLSYSFDELNYRELSENDFVYFDPPYLNSVATYNEHNGWTAEHEKALLSLLDNLDNHGVRFALSNNLKYDNPFLKEWFEYNNMKRKYNIYYLNGNYSNCNYSKIDRTKDVEVLITNY